MLGIKVAASTVWEILRPAGIDPTPQRTTTTWSDFLRLQADALLACDFFETVPLTGARLHVLAAIEHASRRIPSSAPPPIRLSWGHLPTEGWGAGSAARPNSADGLG
jgi:hypothetical protein